MGNISLHTVERVDLPGEPSHDIVFVLRPLAELVGMAKQIADCIVRSGGRMTLRIRRSNHISCGIVKIGRSIAEGVCLRCNAVSGVVG